jgi:hypothetical protein
MFRLFKRKDSADGPSPGAERTKKNGLAGFGALAKRGTRLRVVALITTAFVSSGLAVVVFFAINPAYGAFLGGATNITVSTDYTTPTGDLDDWFSGTDGDGNPIPVSGAATIKDLSDPSSPAPTGADDITRFWMGISTADGTAPGSGNDVQDFYFRVDTSYNNTTKKTLPPTIIFS